MCNCGESAVGLCLCPSDVDERPTCAECGEPLREDERDFCAGCSSDFVTDVTVPLPHLSDAELMQIQGKAVA